MPQSVLSARVTAAMAAAFLFALGSSAAAQSGGPTVRLSQLLGAELADTQGQAVGTVKDVVMNDRNGRVQFLIVDYADRMNAGQGLHAVPYAALKTNAGPNGAMSLDVTPETVKGAEGFTEDSYPDLQNAQTRQTINRRYGVARKAGGKKGRKSAEGANPAAGGAGQAAISETTEPGNGGSKDANQKGMKSGEGQTASGAGAAAGGSSGGGNLTGEKPEVSKPNREKIGEAPEAAREREISEKDKAAREAKAKEKAEAGGQSNASGDAPNAEQPKPDASNSNKPNAETKAGDSPAEDSPKPEASGSGEPKAEANPKG